MIYWLIVILLFPLFQDDSYQRERDRMVKNQIAARGINDSAVLDAMRKVPRHLLVPESLRKKAYLDQPLPIGNGQTISQPYIVASMTSLIQPEKGMKVLEIGTGSGYQAAVLAEIVQEVYTVEIIPNLAKRAENDLKSMGYNNIFIRIGDGNEGWAEHAPYDAILVTAAAEEIPSTLIDQLKEGGRMIIPVGPVASRQELVLVEKKEGKVTTKKLMDVRFVPFTKKKIISS